MSHSGKCHDYKLNIKWNGFITNEDVFERANAEQTKAIILKGRWRYLGHDLTRRQQ